jgi:phage I-like protein
VTDYVISLASNGGGVPGRMPIAQLGIHYRGRQKVEITRTMLAQVVANFRKRDTGEVPIDYDHAILDAGRGDPTPAAGWIKSIEGLPDAQGILWCAVQWAAKAAAMIRSFEYRYISPVLDPGGRDNRTGEPIGWVLTSAALTNTPVLQGMPALVLSDRGWTASEGQSMTEPERVKEIGRLSEEINEAVQWTLSFSRW